MTLAKLWTVFPLKYKLGRKGVVQLGRRESWPAAHSADHSTNLLLVMPRGPLHREIGRVVER